MTTVKRIAVTPGEPAGIGPDLVLAAAGNISSAQLVAIADPGLLRKRARQLGYDDLKIIEFDADRHTVPANTLSVLPVALKDEVIPGRLNSNNATYVLETLETAVDLCQSNIFDAMVTGPVQKSVINDAGIAFTGHTEFIGERTQATPVMMLVAESLRVALVTTHLPLSRVSESINKDNISQVIRILHNDLITKFGIHDPRILVCGLNPHAGEGGHLGREEIDTIIPALDVLRNEGLNLEGPLPADTAFTPHHLQHADAVLAMYHDQGLPVLKYAGFGNAVNVTLGLPVIRTSVDHGTALELAGTGKANSGSLIAAVNLAIEIAHSRTHTALNGQPAIAITT